MKRAVATFQIGKAGISQGVVDALDSIFEHHKHVRVSFLKSSGRTSQNLPGMAKELLGRLKCPCEYTIVGFVLVLRKKLEKARK